MRRPTAVGAYVYAGGFTVGVQEHFDVAYHLEGDDAYGVSSFKLNFPDVPVYHGTKNWNEGIRTWDKDVDFVYANPPCAVWSPIGVGLNQGHGNWRKDPRVAHHRQSFNLLKKLQPRVLAIESVPRVYSITGGREMIHSFARSAKRLGYSSTFLFVNPMWHGLAQNRRRFFYVAHDVEINWRSSNWAPPATIDEVLAEVGDPGWHDKPKPAIQRLLKHVVPGQKLRDAWEKRNPPSKRKFHPDGRVKGRPMFMDHRLHPCKPMGAYAGNYYYHPHEDRKLGINEIKRLCGYPDDFKFNGPERNWTSLIARAVLPPMGRWFAEQVADAVSRGERLDFPEARLLDLSRPPEGSDQYFKDEGVAL